ncbi:MAG: hypothetical protein EZS28_049407 [Streblomastix strix]|uniref:Right handed beta helix domain-containing protein n=1 Tax=Streblomastix strix TaxID=222440 RepID=A0A5J4TA01_9EUKA|nr:MAG: hypothetical protein EZS28_049407 [Streblomastix strix]
MRRIVFLVLFVAYSVFCASCEEIIFKNKAFKLDDSTQYALITFSKNQCCILIDNCSFSASNTSAQYSGTYVHITHAALVTIRNSQFNAIQLNLRPALLFGNNINVSVIEYTNFTGIMNRNGNGSALYLQIHPEFGSHTLNHVIFRERQAIYGGAIFIDLGIQKCTH